MLREPPGMVDMFGVYPYCADYRSSLLAIREPSNDAAFACGSASTRRTS
jgi:hypothetical protein